MKKGIIGLQPGEISNKPLNAIDKSTVASAMKADMKKIGYSATEVKGKKIYNQVKNKKTWLVHLRTTKYSVNTLSIDSEKKRAIYYFADYHWYRQDSDGVWSHKRGKGKVGRKDAEKKKIKNPSQAASVYLTDSGEKIKIGNISYELYYCLDYSGKSGWYKVKKK